MPDITMCLNNECPLKENCWRYKAIPNEHYQSVAMFQPVVDEKKKQVSCLDFLPLKNKQSKK